MRYSIPVFFFLMLLLNFHSYAQPGGGGGLSIQDIYTRQLQKIDLEKDTLLNMRFFIMKDDKVYEESYEPGFNKFDKQKYLSRLFRSRNPKYNGRYDKEFYKRIYLTYKQDTMVIDLINMRGSNGAGYSDSMDSIVVQNGYFKYFLNPDSDRISGLYSERDREGFYHKRLTLASKKKYIRDGYIEFTDKIDLSFLKEEDMPANFFFNRANFYYSKGKFREALNDLNQGLKINNNQKDSEVLDLIHKLHSIKP